MSNKSFKCPQCGEPWDMKVCDNCSYVATEKDLEDYIKDIVEFKKDLESNFTNMGDKRLWQR